jgi:beta-lactam-binding protein with PASTA domain
VRGDEAAPVRRWSVGVLVIAAVAVAALVGALIVGDDEGRRPAAGITTPNLIGLPLDRARATIDGLGLVLGETSYVQTTSLPEGTVVSQEPNPGTAVEAGTMVDLAVSSGLELVVVPEVVGQTEAQAIVTLTGAGLRIEGTDRLADPTVPTGIVMATDPAVGREVAQGTAVRLLVSSGPDVPGPSATPAATPTRTPTPAPTASPPPTPTPPGPATSPSLPPSPPLVSPAPSTPAP